MSTKSIQLRLAEIQSEKKGVFADMKSVKIALIALNTQIEPSTTSDLATKAHTLQDGEAKSAFQEKLGELQESVEGIVNSLKSIPAKDQAIQLLLKLNNLHTQRYRLSKEERKLKVQALQGDNDRKEDSIRALGAENAELKTKLQEQESLVADCQQLAAIIARISATTAGTDQ